jgi:hypothetical protein
MKLTKMNPKHHLTAILILVVFFLFNFSGSAQNVSDTIRIGKKGATSFYYVDGKMLNFKQVSHLVKLNKEAIKLLDKADNIRNASYFFEIIGGGCLGFSAGYALGNLFVGNTINERIFVSTLLAGISITTIGIILHGSANDQIKKGIALYNQSIKQKNNTNLDVGFFINGVYLKLNF